MHSDEGGGENTGGQLTTSTNSDGIVTEQTEVTNTSNDTEVVVTTGLYGSSVVIQARESSPSILQTWGNALRDFLFGERNPTVQHDEDPNAVSAPSAAALGITAPQTLLDAANLRFSGQIDPADASTTTTGSKTANPGVQTVESPDQRPSPSTASFALPQSTTQATQLRLGNVTQPTENGGNTPSGGTFNLGSIDFCNPAVVSDVAAGGTPPCH